LFKIDEKVYFWKSNGTEYGLNFSIRFGKIYKITKTFEFETYSVLERWGLGVSDCTMYDDVPTHCLYRSKKELIELLEHKTAKIKADYLKKLAKSKK